MNLRRGCGRISDVPSESAVFLALREQVLLVRFNGGWRQLHIFADASPRK